MSQKNKSHDFLKYQKIKKKSYQAVYQGSCDDEVNININDIFVPDYF